MSSARFLHLHNHSEYSLLDGAFRVKEIVAAAKEMGMPAVALTDHGNLFGTIPFYNEAVAAGIRPIIGMETYVAQRKMTDRSREGGLGRNDHLVLLVKNERGYRNLIELSSLAFLEGFYYKPRIDLDTLERFSEGLVALSGCIQGSIPRLLRAGKTEEARALAARFASIFAPGDFYLEIQNHGIREELETIPLLTALAAETGLPLVATNDCHYRRADDHGAHDVLLCIQTGKDLDDPNRSLRSHPELYFKSQDEMAALFPDHPEALAATLEIADKCDFSFGDSPLLLPDFPIPEPFGSSDDYLEHLVTAALPGRYPDVTDVIAERARYELGVISRMNFSGYFLIVWDIVNAAREKGIPVGPGRGSAAGSLVTYALGITAIDPLANGLLFERMLNPERVSMPDIDIDFCDERRQEVIEYVVDKYGKESVCQIITFGRMAARAVVRDVGRVLKVPYGEVDALAKTIPGGPGVTLDRALETVPELRERVDADPRIGQLVDLSRRLEGMVRHASTHAAGLVITPGRLVDYVPLFRTNKGEVTTQFEMKFLEEVGVLKIDILGLKTLSHIERTIDLVAEHEGTAIDMDRIPVDDPETFELLREGRTVSVFQLESAGMRDLLRKIGPTNFADVTAVNALYRPGPLGSDMVNDFIECKHGRKKIRYEHPSLEPILRETYGVILYQEQVMRIASDLAGFSLGEADLLRRAMGKKKKEVMEKQRVKFIDGAVERGIPKKTARKIFDLMAFFSGYGFNKSHSAAYAMVSMRTAFLKTHHPAAFMAAAMTSDMGDTSRLIVLLEECRQMGLVVRPPDVNTGGVGFGLADGEITYGLAAVKNVGVGAVAAVVAAREEGGPFADIYDLCDRVDLRQINRRMLENLVQAGALDCLPGTRAQLFTSLETILAQAQKRQNERDRGQFFLGFCEGPEGIENACLADVSDWDDSERLHRERESLGFYFSGHPLEKYREMLGQIVNADSREIGGMADRTPIVLAGLVGEVKTILDRKGNPMAFVTLEDIHGTCEVIVFASSYETCRRKLAADETVVVAGKVSVKDGKEGKIVADTVYTIGEAMAFIPRRVALHIRSDRFGETELAALRETVARHYGERELVFLWRKNGRSPYVVHARNTGVQPGRELYEELKEIAGVEDVEFTM
ncbi:MAG: DNA polymerase III subunit alpha [Candidatus Krumholzibacteriota bacterium]|nr:DNA polymerase III subunit alpha [Candidatus Krumholzibacteriota bacterium]